MVRTPHADRLAAALARECRRAGETGADAPVEVVRESGSSLAVYGSDCPAVGEVAYRYRVIVHQLAHVVGDADDRSRVGPLNRADGRSAAPGTADRVVRPRQDAVALPPPAPSWPLRYELRRRTGVSTVWWLNAVALLAGVVAAIVLAASDSQPVTRVLTGWWQPLPLPPVAVAAGTLGALAFGQEFRYPALAPARVPVPRRLSLLAAKLLVPAAAALLLCCATVALNAAVLRVLFGEDRLAGGSWGTALHSVAAFSIGCAWAGLLAAGLFRSAPVGLAAVAAVPLALAPALRALLEGPAGRSLDGLPGRLSSLTMLPIPSGSDRWVSASVQLASQPVGWALALSLAVLLGGYALVSLSGGLR